MAKIGKLLHKLSHFLGIPPTYSNIGSDGKYVVRSDICTVCGEEMNKRTIGWLENAESLKLEPWEVIVRLDEATQTDRYKLIKREGKGHYAVVKKNRN